MSNEILKVTYKSKRCDTCGRILPYSDFHLYSDGRIDTCKECESRLKVEKGGIQQLISVILN
jgi:hypothetical protein